jgi:hypothetical protein
MRSTIDHLTEPETWNRRWKPVKGWMREDTLSRQAHYLNAATPATLQIRAQAPRPFGQRRSSHEHRTAGPSRRSLAPREAENCNVTEATEQLTIQRSACRLGGVLNHRYSVFCREVPHADHVGWVSVKMRNHDRVNTASDYATYGLKVGAQRRRIEVVQAHPSFRSEGRGSEIDAGVGGKRDSSAGRQNSSQSEDES